MGTGLKRAMRPITYQLRLFSNRLLGIEPELEIDPALFWGFSDTELRLLAPKIARTRFRRKQEGIVGWMTQRERQTLYAFARWLPGPFLEIGPWVGLSTSAIAQGIRGQVPQQPDQFVNVRS